MAEVIGINMDENGYLRPDLVELAPNDGDDSKKIFVGGSGNRN